MSREGLKDADEATAFFEEMWQKLIKNNGVHVEYKPPKAQYVD